MLYQDLWKYLHDAHRAVKTGTTQEQADTINRLFGFLDSRKEQQFPHLFYTEAIRLFQWYVQHTLPAQGYAQGDTEEIAQDYALLIEQLERLATVSERLENVFWQLILRIKQNEILHMEDVINEQVALLRTSLDDIVVERTADIQTLQEQLTHLQQDFRATSAFRFFQKFSDFFWGNSTSVSSTYLRRSHNIRNLFEYVLYTYVGNKAVLVDPGGHGILVPLDIDVNKTSTSEHVLFLNHDIDSRMQASADIARFVARNYLKETFHQDIAENIAIQCRFVNPSVKYQDSSASLLIALCIVGEILELENAPFTAVTGELHRSGNVLRVNHIHQKITCVEEEKSINRILIPASNIEDISVPYEQEDLIIVPVRTFHEAVEQYYGEARLRACTPALNTKLTWQQQIRAAYAKNIKQITIAIIIGLLGVMTVSTIAILRKQARSYSLTLQFFERLKTDQALQKQYHCVEFLPPPQEGSIYAVIDFKTSPERIESDTPTVSETNKNSTGLKGFTTYFRWGDWFPPPEITEPSLKKGIVKRGVAIRMEHIQPDSLPMVLCTDGRIKVEPYQGNPPQEWSAPDYFHEKR